MDPLFPALPETLAEATDEELSSYEAGHLDAIGKIRAKDTDFTGDREAAQILTELKAGIEALKAVQAEMARRVEAEANYDEELESATADVKPFAADPQADDDEGTGDEPAPEDEASAEAVEPLAADTETKDEEEAPAETPDEEPAEVVASQARPVRLPRRARSHEPVVMAPAESAGAKLTATMEFGGVRGGTPLDKDSLVRILDDAIVRTEGMTAKTVLAQARAVYPDGERLSRNPTESHAVISRLRDQIRSRSMDEIVASGGRCAPFTPRYDLPFIATDSTPVWDSLAQVGADRGGITFPTPLGISDVTDGITVVTAAEDAAGGGSAVKNCVVVTCDEFQDAETAAIAACIEHGNFGARSWPERVDNLADLLRVAHAQATEQRLLTLMKAGSDQYNDEAKYGAVSTLLQGMVKLAAQYRNRHRMDPRAPLNTIIPAWTVDLMVADVNHVAFNRFVAQAQMEAQLRSFNLNPVFYIDSAVEAGGAQNMAYGANAGGGNLDEFKTTVEWGLYAPDTWLGLDGGRLDVGLIRDSVLNATNDFQLFFETWIGLAKIGIESDWITSTVCPSGATAPAGTLITCA